MHRGVRQFLKWVGANRATLTLNPPASNAELRALEQTLGGPLPSDLRLILTRFNGGELPVGKMLPVGLEPGTIGAAVRDYAQAVKKDFLDPALLLPVCQTAEGSLLAFDRSAGPVSDTWPIVDYYPDTGEERMIHRTMDGWCQTCVNEWESGDFGAEFTLDVYLRKGERHVNVEPDVATAYASVAHARKRAGMPEESMKAYLAAARCVPPLPWCDWEALKIAVLIDKRAEAYEASSRLAARAPSSAWEQRETTPLWVAQVVAPLARRTGSPSRWVRMLSQLEEAADDDERPDVHAIRMAIETGGPFPPLDPLREEPLVPPQPDLDAWFTAVKRSYHAGVVRDEDLLLEPSMAPLRERYPLGDCLRARRDF